MPVVHFAHARHKRGKGAHDGHEAGEDDGFAAVFFVKSVGFGEVFGLEDFAVGAGEEFCAEIFADFKIGCVAQNGGGKQHGNDKVHVERASRGGGNSAGGKQQRIPW